MKYAIKLYTALSLVFILLLSISGSVGGFFSTVIYVAAFAIPAIIGLVISQRLHVVREEERGISLPNKWYCSLDGESIRLFAPLVMPSIALIMILSFLTSLLLNLLGAQNQEVELFSLPYMLVMDALVPAVMEELLFRYLPLRLILPYSRRGCILISSLYFALIHCNLFSLPYALLAGVIFISLDIAFDSVLPSLILHFLNNALSVVMLKYCNTPTANAVYFGFCAVVLVISLAFVFKNKSRYIALARGIMQKEAAADLGYYPFLLLVPTLLVAFINLF